MPICAIRDRPLLLSRDLLRCSMRGTPKAGLGNGRLPAADLSDARPVPVDQDLGDAAIPVLL